VGFPYVTKNRTMLDVKRGHGARVQEEQQEILKALEDRADCNGAGTSSSS
jgi:hypothetical protein